MPSEATEQRKLAAIMFTDMVGYSALAQRDDKLALELLEEHRRLLREILPRFNGTEIKTIGDAFLIEFQSALEAAQCAIEIQRTLAKRNHDVTADRRIELKIGIHIGDVVHRGGDVYGDGVNIASRIEPLAGAGGICVSMDVERQIRNALEARFEKLAPTELKNISVPMDLFRIVLPWEQMAKAERVGTSVGGRSFAVSRLVWVGAIVLAFIAFGWWWSDRQSGKATKSSNMPSTAPTADQKSIAVLPFENLSHDQENAYLADGIQEEILTRLANISELKVISRTSAAKFRSSPDNLREIAGKLGVANILEGSVQRSADQVRVNVQLINAAIDAHLWADTYDRKLTDVFVIETEIAKAVADKLKAKLTGREQHAISSHPTESSEAHQLYLKGRYFWNKRTSDGLKTAIGYFNQAIEKDPGYGPAYAGLADAYAVLPNYSETTGQDAYPKAEAAALKALALNDDLAEAHISLANVRLWHRWGNGAESEFKKGLQLNSNYSTGHQWYSIYLAVTGRLGDAITEMERAKELDPFSIIINTELGCPYLYSKQYDRAIAYFGKALEMDADFPFAHFALAEAYDRSGRYKEALAEHEKAVALAQQQHAVALHGTDAPAAWYALTGPLQNAYRALHGPGYWQQRLESAKKLHAEHAAPATAVAGIYAILGDNEQAFAWLEKAYQESDDFLVFVNIQPQFENLHSDPRFAALMRKIGFTEP